MSDNPPGTPVYDAVGFQLRPITRDEVKAMLRAYYDDDSIRVKTVERDGSFRWWFLARLEIAIVQVVLSWWEGVVHEEYYKHHEPLTTVAAKLGCDERTTRRYLNDMVDKYVEWMNRDIEDVPV